MDKHKDSFNYFPVCGDVNPVRQRADRIERMFSVKVKLEQQCSKTKKKNFFVYQQGLKRDLCNARAYILSLVLSNNSIYTREKTIYLPSSITDDVIERVESKSTAAIIPGRDVGVFFVRGSDISVNTAMTMLEELVSEAQPPSLPQTPVRPNKASRRLSSALYETLTKRHTRENYNTVANAVKRAIASCIMEDTIIEDESGGKSEDNKNKDDKDIDYIIIDDSFQNNEPVIQEADDSDLMIIETPRKPTAKDDKSQLFFGENFDGAMTESVVDKLTDAFGELKTPSKTEGSVTKQDITGAKPKACVKPQMPSTLNNENKELPENKDRKEGVKIMDTTNDDKRSDDKNKKDRKKSRSEKEDKKARYKRKRSENVEEFTSKQSKLLQEAVNGSNGNVSKRRRLRSTVQIADDVFKTTEKSEITSEANKRVIDDAHGTDRERKSRRASKRRKSHRSGRKKKSRWDRKSRDRRSRSKDRREACSPQKQPQESVSRFQTPRNNSLRYIVVDGSNVAMSHGGNSGVFSCKGIRLCVDFFRRRGHSLITVFLPRWRQYRPDNPNSVTERYILDELEKEGTLVYTPSRRIGNRLVASYDDRFIIELAEREDGIVVSNDEYRDLKMEKSSWRDVIENRLLMFSWVRDHFMVPEDPLGRYGPNLNDFLRHPSSVNKMDAHPVMPLPSYKNQLLVMPNILRTVNFTYGGTSWNQVVRT